ncbi:MAG: hypothetical protein VX346_04135 [Planctomycetota bacterium]|nr:hypothetical protein [Planctomycetota bacterium]
MLLPVELDRPSGQAAPLQRCYEPKVTLLANQLGNADAQWATLIDPVDGFFSVRFHEFESILENRFDR